MAFVRRHQIITSTNGGLSWTESCSIHLKATAMEIRMKLSLQHIWKLYFQDQIHQPQGTMGYLFSSEIVRYGIPKSGAICTDSYFTYI